MFTLLMHTGQDVTVFVIIFSLFFVSVPCASQRKYTVPYRIVLFTPYYAGTQPRFSIDSVPERAR